MAETYQTYQIWVKPGHRLFPYFESLSGNAKRLYNVTNFYIRQIYTALKQDKAWQPLQQEVMDTLTNTINLINERQQQAYEKRRSRKPTNLIETQNTTKQKLFTLPTKETSMVTYEFLDALFKVIQEKNYYSLPTQSSQAIMKVVFQNWKGFFASLKAYKMNPSVFLGKPRIPGYSKAQQKEIIFSNQDAIIKEGRFLKLPHTKHRLNLGKVGHTGGKLKQVRVIPSYGQYVVEVIVERTEVEVTPSPQNRFMAIDEGIDNLATLVTNTGITPVLVKGKALKSMNQYYNKQKAHYMGILRQGKQPQEGQYTSARLNRLHRKRFLKVKDYFHKASLQIVEIAIKEQISTIIIGHNKGWKQQINIGKQNNQSFVNISHSLLNQMIAYKAERAGIKVIVQEESYTSKASFLDNDDIPTYGEVTTKPVFSGKRIRRGLYRSKDEILINADVNGAYNILRKAVPNGFSKGIEGLDSLLAVAVSTPRVISVR